MERARKMRRELVRSGAPRYCLDRPSTVEPYVRWEARWPIFVFPEPSEKEAGIELAESEPFTDPLGEMPHINRERHIPRCGVYQGTTQIPRDEFLESGRTAAQPAEKRQKRPFLVRHGDLDSGAGPSWPITTRSPRREKILTKKGPEMRHVFYDEAEGAHCSSFRTKWPLPEAGPSDDLRTSLQLGELSHRTKTSGLLRSTIPKERPSSLHPDSRIRANAVYARDKKMECVALEDLEITPCKEPTVAGPSIKLKDKYEKREDRRRNWEKNSKSFRRRKPSPEEVKVPKEPVLNYVAEEYKDPFSACLRRDDERRKIEDTVHNYREVNNNNIEWETSPDRSDSCRKRSAAEYLKEPSPAREVRIVDPATRRSPARVRRRRRERDARAAGTGRSEPPKVWPPRGAAGRKKCSDHGMRVVEMVSAGKKPTLAVSDQAFMRRHVYQTGRSPERWLSDLVASPRVRWMLVPDEINADPSWDVIDADLMKDGRTRFSYGRPEEKSDRFLFDSKDSVLYHASLQ